MLQACVDNVLTTGAIGSPGATRCEGVPAGATAVCDGARAAARSAGQRVACGICAQQIVVVVVEARGQLPVKRFSCV